MTIYADIGLNLVQEFHDRFGIVTPLRPAMPEQWSAEEAALVRIADHLHKLAEEIRGEAAVHKSKPLKRLQLIVSEIGELADGFVNMDLVEILDALGDITYVTDGTYLEYGLGTRKIAALREIHRSNMSKLDDRGQPIVEPSGRIVKGPKYKPPCLTPIVIGEPSPTEGPMEELARKLSAFESFKRTYERIETEAASGARSSSVSTDIAMAKVDRDRAQEELNEALAKYLR